LAWVLAGLALLGTPAGAQLLGGRLPLIGSLPDLPGRQALSTLQTALDPQALLDARRVRLDDFVRDHRAKVELDAAGQPVVRGEVLALAPAPATLEAAAKAGFGVLRREKLDALDLDVVVLSVPQGLSAVAALKRLRRIDPQGSFDYDHLYFGAGGASAPTPAAAGTGGGQASHGRVGVIDTGADARHPAFVGVRLTQKGFATGAPAPAAHGTATAALIAGRQGAFSGAAPGASVWVADVYGTGGAGGSALDLARAFAWMAEVRAPVVSVSLVGPANRVLEGSVRALQARGQVVVAAVGNDGPAAPPQYPASYPGVIAVSAVDGRNRPLLEAGHALHVDFCAPGADMAAPAGASGYASVRGTSFAAPLVAGLLADRMEAPAPQPAADALAALARTAAPVGPSCGHGVVGASLRVAPRALNARAWPEG
jgi:subtilisin family serine protease